MPTINKKGIEKQEKHSKNADGDKDMVRPSKMRDGCIINT